MRERSDTVVTHRQPLPGWRRYRCGGCGYQYETRALPGAPAPDQCGLCGRPWVAVAETVGQTVTTR